jgi:sugar/nucleoside kinase (ribokinase family)
MEFLHKHAMLQHILPAFSTVHIGSIGEDDDGKNIIQVAKKNKITGVYSVAKKQQTGRCLVIITDIHRLHFKILDQ